MVAGLSGTHRAMVSWTEQSPEMTALTGYQPHLQKHKTACPKHPPSRHDLATVPQYDKPSLATSVSLVCPNTIGMLDSVTDTTCVW